MELDAALDKLPTPFRVSTQEADAWSAAAEDVAAGPRRARRRLRVMDGDEVLAEGFLDAVGWPVNISHLLDAVRLYPIGRSLDEAETWQQVRLAAVRRAGRWYALAGVDHFCFIDEPARAVEGPEPSKPRLRLEGPDMIDGLKPACPGMDPYERAAGRQWTLRRGGTAAGTSAPGGRGRFSAFAAWAEGKALAELPAL